MTTETITTEAIKAAAQTFVATWDEHFQTYLASFKFHQQAEHIVLTTQGKKFWRIVETRDGRAASAAGFIDTSNGDVLFCAGWAGPAKHARGNVLDADNGLSALELVGRPHVRYLK